MKMRELRHAAWDRQRGRCAATGLRLGDPDDDRWDLHHRLPGGMGGTTLDRDVLSNVVCLLAPAHNMGSPNLAVEGVPGRSVHTDPMWSRSRGLLLSAGQRQPSEYPVHIAGVGWVFLSDGGGWVRLA